MSTPTCFGKKWDPQHPECKGGNDPTYAHPHTGKNVRDKCSWFSQCGQAQQAQQVIPATNLRPPPVPQQQQQYQGGGGYHQAYAQPYQQIPMPPPAPPAPVPPAGGQRYPQQQYVQHPQQQQYVQPQYQVMNNVPYAQLEYAHQPYLVPVNQPMMGGQVPNFLMVPEPLANIDYKTLLFRTVARAVIKAAALALANYIDYHAFTRQQQQQ